MDFANLLSNAKSGDGNKYPPAALPAKPASVKKFKTTQGTTSKAVTPSKSANSSRAVFRMDMPLPTGSFKSVTGPTVKPDDKPSDAVSSTAQPAPPLGVASPIRELDAALDATSPVPPKEVTCSETSTKAAFTKIGPITKETIIKAESTKHIKQITVTGGDTTAIARKSAKEVSTISKDITPLKGATPAKQGATPGKKAAAASTGKLQSSASEQRMSLARLKADAMATIKERLMAVSSDYDKFVHIISTTKGKKLKETVEGALQEAMRTLAALREALEKDLNKLKSFGEGFDLAQIKRIDAQALVALSHWSDATVMQSRSDTAPAQATPARTVKPVAAPLEEIAPEVVSKDEPIRADEKIEKPSPRKEEVQHRPATSAIPKQDVPAPPSLAEKPAPKLARKSSAMVPSKRAGAKPATARPTVRIPLSREQAKKKTVILDMEEAVDAEAMGTVAEAKRTVKRGHGGFVTSKPKGRLSADEDGRLKIRKNALAVVGKKRKRGDVVEGPNKRSAIEGRAFKPLRTRPTPPMSEAMEIDTEPAPSSAMLSLIV